MEYWRERIMKRSWALEPLVVGGDYGSVHLESALHLSFLLGLFLLCLLACFFLGFRYLDLARSFIMLKIFMNPTSPSNICGMN